MYSRWVYRSIPLTEAFESVEQTEVFGYVPTIVIIAIFLAAIAHVLLKNTRYGRAIYAVGGNNEAARVSGINIRSIKMSVYAIAGGLAGFSGIMMTSRLGSAQASSGTGFEMTVIAATIIGGTSTYGGIGTILGSVLGAFFLEVLSNSLTIMRISVYWQDILTGAIVDRRSRYRHL